MNEIGGIACTGERQDAIIAGVSAAWERAFGIRSLPLDADFFALGGTRDHAVIIFAALDALVGQELSPSLLYEFPTIASLAEAIGRNPQPASDAVCLRSGAGAPVIMLPGGTGLPFELMSIAAAIGNDSAVYAIQGAWWTSFGNAPLSVEAMAVEAVASIRRVQPQGPYAIVGYSFGGLIGVEVSRALVDAGETVQFLALVDTPVAYRTWPARAWLDLGIQRLGRKTHRLLGRVWRMISGTPRPAPSNVVDLMSLPRYNRLWRAMLAATEAYMPGSVPVPTVVIRSTGGLPGKPNAIHVWPACLGNIEIVSIPGDHLSIIEGPGARMISQWITRRVAGSLSEGLARNALPPESAGPDLARGGTHFTASDPRTRWHSTVA